MLMCKPSAKMSNVDRALNLRCCKTVWSVNANATNGDANPLAISVATPPADAGQISHDNLMRRPKERQLEKDIGHQQSAELQSTLPVLAYSLLPEKWRLNANANFSQNGQVYSWLFDRRSFFPVTAMLPSERRELVHNVFDMPVGRSLRISSTN